MPSQGQDAFGGGSLVPMDCLWFGESMNICKTYFQLEFPVRLTSSSLPPLWKLLLHFTLIFLLVFMLLTRNHALLYNERSVCSTNPFFQKTEASILNSEGVRHLLRRRFSVSQLQV